MNTHGSSKQRNGFTLTELLVVIAIVGVLAAILVPVAQSARRKAHATKCLSNLRQWGVAFNLYAAEHKNMFPASAPKVGNNTYSWQHSNAPLTQTFQDKGNVDWNEGEGINGCPAHLDGPSGVSGYDRRYYSYVYNYNLGINPVHMSVVRRPAKLIVLADSNNDLGNQSGFSHNYGQEARIGFVHNGQYQALYADWHVGSSAVLNVEENVIP